MTQINQLYGRLAHDTSTQESLFTGSFTGIKSVELKLSSIAEGTANFAIYENGQEKVSQKVTKGQSVSYPASQPDSVLEFYVNYYDGSDLPTADALITQ